MSKVSKEEFKENKEKAYKDGYENGKEAGRVLRDDGEIKEMSEDGIRRAVGQSLDGYVQYAGWANHILPWLRSLAGYEDESGMGTYRGGGVDAKMDSRYEELVDEWQRGYYEGAEEVLLDE